MRHAQPSLFARDDTFFGVCEGLGEDFGFNPLYLRLAFTLLLFWQPVAALAAYAAAGLVVAFTRWLHPSRPADTLRLDEAADRFEPASAPDGPHGDNDERSTPIAAAA